MQELIHICSNYGTSLLNVSSKKNLVPHLLSKRRKREKLALVFSPSTTKPHQLKLQLDIASTEEKPQEFDSVVSHKRSLACMIKQEISAVLAVLRTNVQWGGRYMSGDDQSEHPLIQSLKALRKQIFSCQNSLWHSTNPTVYLQPFLDVVSSDETGAGITVVALSAVYKILTLGKIDQNTVGVEVAMPLVVDAVTSCRFEITDPSAEEAVLMKMLEVLLACMKSKASVALTNQHVCTTVNTCYRIIHQAGSKSETLQRMARHTMQELVWCIFSHLSDTEISECALVNGVTSVKQGIVGLENGYAFGSKRMDSGSNNSELSDSPISSGNFGSNASSGLVQTVVKDTISGAGTGLEDLPFDLHLCKGPYGAPCMVEIFHFLCALLNAVEHKGMGSGSNTIAFDEDVPFFALGLINSAIELGGPSIRNHPRLLSSIQDELFRSLMHFGLSMSPRILSMVCSIVLNLYQYLRVELKLQLEAFFSCVILRFVQRKYGASYQHQEVAMETLVDFCRQKTFMVEMYANLDCDITCSNLSEDLVNFLSKSAFPMNCSLSQMHIVALDGLIAVLQAMAERIDNSTSSSKHDRVTLESYTPFWTVECDSYGDPNHWVPFVRRRKYIKRRLRMGADHFNRDPKKGLEYLQGTNLLPEKLDPQSVACFFRYTAGLDKNLVGDFLGNHDEFCIQVLHEFAGTFDFQDMNLDSALRLFLESFRLPGESQKIERVLEAFSERYYDQSPMVLANKDAALVLSYSLIMLNTDQHNVQVKKKMTEEDFIRNNRGINEGKDLPREFLSELYHSICKNELRSAPEQGVGFPEMTPSRWIDLMNRSKKTTPFIVSDSKAYLDYDIFAIMSGPAIATISVVFDHAEHEDLYQTCIDGFLAIAKISSCHHLEDVLDDLVASLCKFTGLLNPLNAEEPVHVFGGDTKGRLAAMTVFTIVNRYGDFIRSGWRNIMDCILRLHKLGLLPARMASDAAEEPHFSPDSGHGKLPTSFLLSVHMQSVVTPRGSPGLMGRFSKLLSLESEGQISQPTLQQLAAHQHTLQIIQKCHIDTIFTRSKFLKAESLWQLARAIICTSGQPQKVNSSPEDEDTAVFCLELLIATTLNNRDRIVLLWQAVYKHIANILQSTAMPCALAEKAVFGLLRICQRLLPYQENLADELLRSLQLLLKLDASVADAYCGKITQEVSHLLKANATHIRSLTGWRTIASLLSITAHHPEASRAGFNALLFIMSDKAHFSPVNYVLCVDAARQFAESSAGQVERSVLALDLMASSVDHLVGWSHDAKEGIGDDESAKRLQDIDEMWLRLVHELRKVCVDRREEVRNHALSSLQKCLTGMNLPNGFWFQCFDLVIFTMLDELLEIAEGRLKDHGNMDDTLVIAVKLLSKVFLELLEILLQLTSFCKLWLGVLSRMEKYMKVKIEGKNPEKIQEVVPELLKNTLLEMKNKGVLVQRSADSLWELTWLHVNNIAPLLQSAVFTDLE